ncbi:hypothetical protein [Candidatus Alkanophaga liquidiphilum]|nr:hypothetical protein [Candidatus Alkanophaga liquidiphilum]
MEEIEWKSLAEVDLDARLSQEGLELGDAHERQRLKMGVRCKDAGMVDEVIDRIMMKMRSRGAKCLIINYKGCSSSEDYQQRTVDTITEFLKIIAPERVEEIPEGAPLNERATACLRALEDVANELRNDFLLILDFRGMKIEPRLLRPGQMFWWVYEAASRCEPANLIWIMDDDLQSFEMLAKHGQMYKVFSEGTQLFVLV